LDRFYRFCAACKVPEVITFARTIETWQAPIIAALQTGLTNARTEGYNRIVKHVGRIAFGFRNPDNQRRRVRWACTRQSRRVTPSRPLLTAKSRKAGAQGASHTVGRITGSAAVATGLLLDALADQVELGPGQRHDVEGVHLEHRSPAPRCGAPIPWHRDPRPVAGRPRYSYVIQKKIKKLSRTGLG
jgi:hypothetical protein